MDFQRLPSLVAAAGNGVGEQCAPWFVRQGPLEMSGGFFFSFFFFSCPFSCFFSRSSLSVRIWPRSPALYVYFLFLLLSIFEGLEWTTAQIAACSSGAIRKLRRCVSGRILRLGSYVLPLADPTCPALVSAAYHTGRPPSNISSHAS